MEKPTLQELKLEIQLQSKKGIDFLVAASIVWFLIFIIWKLNLTAYNKSVLTFMVGAILLPLAFGLSKIFKTQWKIKDNPLQPLGLWLNFAQLIYFPFLIFIFIKYPEYFIMAYAIITGAHLFPYAWFYDEIGYAVSAITISVGALILALNVGDKNMFYIPVFTAFIFFIFSIWLFFGNKRLKKNEQNT
ncbi:MAG: hypothetical protein V7767_02150 [Leeuwenhoekiella sp.]